MRRISQLDPEDNRIGGFAALLTLGGHAAVILTALALSGRSVSRPEPLNMVSVTLVSAGAGDQAKGALGQSTPTNSQPIPIAPEPAPSPAPLSGELLDRLSASDPQPVTSREPRGRALAGSGAKPGEGVAGIDLYAVAGLPPVGQRPSVSPDGDLWQKVAPCWRPSVARAVTLAVEIQDGGNLGSAIQAIRRPAGASDALTLAAERSALRALQACAPYPGIAAQRWRIDFPAEVPKQIPKWQGLSRPVTDG